jgi:hypothetical protein
VRGLINCSARARRHDANALTDSKAVNNRKPRGGRRCLELFDLYGGCLLVFSRCSGGRVDDCRVTVLLIDEISVSLVLECGAPQKRGKKINEGQELQRVGKTTDFELQNK